MLLWPHGSSHLETFGSCCECACLVQALFVVAQDEVEQPVVAVVVLAVLLHTELLQVASTLLLTMLALPAAISLQQAYEAQALTPHLTMQACI